MTVISRMRGSWFCTRNTRIRSTIENHCHRDRRSLSMRSGNRTKSPKPILPCGADGPQLFMQATAKNPAISNSKNRRSLVHLFPPLGVGLVFIELLTSTSNTRTIVHAHFPMAEESPFS